MDARKVCDNQIEILEDLLKDCNQANGKHKISELLSRISEIQPYVKYLKVSDRWL